MTLEQLTIPQLELGLQHLHRFLTSRPKEASARPMESAPPELSHLTEKDWLHLSGLLMELQRQKAVSTIH